MMELKFIRRLHKSTQRNYLDRMLNEKIKCMNIARKYGYDYWDGERKYGYGGNKYIPGHWEEVAKKIIKHYKLSNKSKILDVGCGKAFLLYEIKKILNDVEVVGFDISKYAINNSKKEIKKNLFIYKAQDNYPFKKNHFDLAISLGCFHNLEIFDLKKGIGEFNRVAKKKFLMVESYRSDQELFNLQCWALTCNSFFSKKEWIWLLKSYGYNGDYEFIYFE
jgi:ubiquinone/menaquinone biosynthesis C-methylase UbiE